MTLQCQHSFPHRHHDRSRATNGQFRVKHASSHRNVLCPRKSRLPSPPRAFLRAIDSRGCPGRHRHANETRKLVFVRGGGAGAHHRHAKKNVVVWFGCLWRWGPGTLWSIVAVHCHGKQEHLVVVRRYGLFWLHHRLTDLMQNSSNKIFHASLACCLRRHRATH